jgi:pilus assembly protein Flp/PilA
VTRTSTCGSRTSGDRGSSTVEYGLMIAALAAALVGVLVAAGGIVSEAVSSTCSTFSSSLAAGGNCATTELGRATDDS